MASSAGPIGYGLPRPNSVTPFSGTPSQDFDLFREQIQQSTYFSYFNLLNPDAQPTLDKLFLDAAKLQATNEKEETAKNTASITHRETKAKNMLQEDAILFNQESNVYVLKNVKERRGPIAIFFAASSTKTILPRTKVLRSGIVMLVFKK